MVKFTNENKAKLMAEDEFHLYGNKLYEIQL